MSFFLGLLTGIVVCWGFIVLVAFLVDGNKEANLPPRHGKREWGE